MARPDSPAQVLWLIEHVARELDIACAVRALLEKDHGISVAIRNIYLHTSKTFRQFEPKLIVHPFFYFADYMTGAYVRRWPTAIHFNVAWEQIYYQGIAQSKAPQDDFAQKAVLHHAWGQFYSDFLKGQGVPEDRIFLNGNPVYQLYLPPYSHYFPSRQALAQKYGLDPNHRWIFVPENYRWAFNTDIEIARKVEAGGDRREMEEMRSYCRRCLTTLLSWCRTLCETGKVTVIFRPKPITPKSQMLEFYRENVSTSLPRGLVVEKGESVREWILASDLTISSFSTTLIEASVTGKPAFMVEPEPILPSLSNDWYKYVTHLRKYEEFAAACLGSTVSKPSSALRSWAFELMLANGDPIRRLSDFLANQVRGTDLSRVDFRPLIPPDRFPNPSRFKFLPRNVKAPIREVLTAVRRALGGLDANERDHEMDFFRDRETETRVRTWTEIFSRPSS